MHQHKTPGSVLEKKLTGGSVNFFGSEIFDILIFLGLEKSLSLFLGLKIFHLFFGGNNFDTIHFFGARLNDLDLQNRSLKSDQVLELKTLTYAQSTYFFGSVIFMNLFFWV